MTACTTEEHEALKADVPRFLRETLEPKAWPDSDLYMGGCPICTSTLTIPLAVAVKAGAL